MKQFNKKSHWHFYCDKILTNSGEFFVNDNTEVSGNFILNKDASFHDVVDISNTLRVGYDKDITSYLGHTAIGGHSGASGHAVFGHMDIINGTNYALKQTSAGNTYINAKALQSIQFRIGHNTEMMRITTNGKVGIGMSNPVKLLEVDGDVSAAAFYGDGSNLTGVAAELPSQTSNAGKLLTTNGSSASWATDVSLSNLDLSSNLIVKGDISAHNFKSSRIFVGNSAENDIIKIGRDAAANNPGDYSIAIGYDTGCSFSSGNSSGLYSIAIGALAGRGGQGAKSIAIGYHSGNANGVQGSNSICIGDQSKTSATYGIVIGTNAACSIGQKAIVLNTANANFGSLNLEKSLVLNAGHMPVIPALDEACYISPIRNAQNYSVLQFNRTTNEVTEASNIDISFIVSQDLSVNAALDVGGALKGATATFTGAVEAAKDTNTKNYFGRTAIGYFGHTDWGGVSHVDNATANNYAIIQNNEGKTLINSTANNYIDFRNANNRKMTMTSAGKFGIGITNPSTLLHVDGDATINENLGIGLTNPDVSFEVIGDISCSGRIDATGGIDVGNSAIKHILFGGDNASSNNERGLYWHTNNTNYGIYRTSGAWSANAYQQLMIKWRTGIIIDAGGGESFDKSHLGIVGGVSIGTTYYSTKSDNNLLVEGKLGVGLTNPTKKFEVVGDISASGDISCSGAFSAGYDTDITSYFGRAAIGFVGNLGTFSHVDSNTGTTYALGQNSAGNTYINTASTKFIAFRVNNADKMRLDADGDLGIGLTNPTKKLEVVGDISCSGGVTVNSDTSFNAQVDVSGVLKFGNSATQNTLPTGRGTNGQFLKTNGSGALSWAAAGGGAFTITNDAIESNTTGTNVNTTSGSPSISIGPNSGNSGQGIKSIAMGYEAGKLNQGAHSVAIGSGAGWTTQDPSSVAIGPYAGHTAQGVHNVAIGALAGRQYQGDYAVAIGSGAGETQYTGCVAIGMEAGATNQRTRSVAIGQSAGRKNQGYGNGYAIAIGANAASDVGTDKEQAAYAICIGHYAAYSNQGTAAIAIGRGAGYQNQSDNSIVIDATNAWNGANVDYDAGASRCYIAPIRNATGDDYLGYDSTTKEITYSNGAPSDDRLKHNEVDITNGLSIIRQLKPQKYQKTRKMYPADYTGDISGEWRWETGVIAQDILQINDISFVVVGGHNSKQSVRDSSGKVISDTSDPSNICNLESDVSTNYGVKYNNIFTYNIAATKELDAIVTELSNNLLAANNKITTLEQENVTIKAALNTLLTAAGQNTI